MQQQKKCAKARKLFTYSLSINPFSDYYWYCWLQSFNNFSMLVCTASRVQIDQLAGNKNKTRNSNQKPNQTKKTHTHTQREHSKNHSASLNFMRTVEMLLFRCAIDIKVRNNYNTLCKLQTNRQINICHTLNRVHKDFCLAQLFAKKTRKLRVKKKKLFRKIERAKLS